MLRQGGAKTLNVDFERQVTMSTLLRIDASARIEGSHSRTVADAYQEAWSAQHPGGRIILRDVVKDPIPRIQNDTILGYYAPQDDLDDKLKAATALSDTLINELDATNTLLISTPMYNFSVPSALKAWIDQIVRVGRTFGYDEERSLHGLIENKNAVIITAAGAAYTGTELEALDFLSPYLQTLLGFLGFNDVEFIAVEGTTTDEEVLAKTESEALERVHLAQAA